ncbi:MAG: pentapeptide repeat-containing protein [candidate division Zixibacteria bacterium]|nr:pentapeptide repeat-containing protein [candidate division Zixibacteria bacterium]
MADKTCAYEGCNEPVNTPHDDTVCVFHAPKENKGIGDEKFNRLIFEKINREDYNFKGFIFPCGLFFRENGEYNNKAIVFKKDVDFSFANFEGIFTRYIHGIDPLDINECVSFEKVEFLEKATFEEARFSKGGINFQSTVFHGNADFTGVKFGGMVMFSHSDFKKSSDFSESCFSNIIIFEGTVFRRNVSFKNSIFTGVSFNESVIEGYADFIDTNFNGWASFNHIKLSKGASFANAIFTGQTTFHNAYFKNSIYFENNVFKNDVGFVNIYFDNASKFYFRNPNFSESTKENDTNTIFLYFNGINFKPMSTFFEKILVNEHTKNKVIKGYLVFRYCDLSRVYFVSCNMTYLSFFKNSLNQALFIANTWSHNSDNILFFKYIRQNIIPEENFLRAKRKVTDKKSIGKIETDYAIEELKYYNNVSAIYGSLKTLSDYAKDYQQASRFYFNEFEMKRRHLEEQIESSKPKWKIFRWQPCIWFNQQRKKIFSRYLLFFSYKVLAGYGEKPLWSSIWFAVFSIIFSFVHLFSGLFKQTRTPLQEMQYNVIYLFSDIQTTQFWKDFVESLIYTVSRVLPVSYISTSPTDCYPFTTLGKIASVFNSVILIILVIFIGIGLKRHFRRF